MHERPAPRLLSIALLVGLLCAALAAGTAVTRAQAPDPAPPTDDRQTDDALAEDAEQRPAPAAQDDTATGQATGPLEDYEASEQISEDLSVSFPVDI